MTLSVKLSTDESEDMLVIVANIIEGLHVPSTALSSSHVFSVNPHYCYLLYFQ